MDRLGGAAGTEMASCHGCGDSRGAAQGEVTEVGWLRQGGKVLLPCENGRIGTVTTRGGDATSERRGLATRPPWQRTLMASGGEVIAVWGCSML